MEKKILIIDDNRLAREINRFNLAEAGYEIITASDGAEGLAKLKIEKIDLIILDLVMPGLDGFGFLSICKNDPLTRRIPVMVLTGRDSLEEIDKVKSLGALVCEVKHRTPPKSILESVKTILGQ